MIAPIVNTLSVATNNNLQHLDGSDPFFCGVLVGVLITILAIALVKLLYYIFV